MCVFPPFHGGDFYSWSIIVDGVWKSVLFYGGWRGTVTLCWRQLDGVGRYCVTPGQYRLVTGGPLYHRWIVPTICIQFMDEPAENNKMPVAQRPLHRCAGGGGCAPRRGRAKYPNGWGFHACHMHHSQNYKSATIISNHQQPYKIFFIYCI